MNEDKAARYHRLKRRSAALSLVVSAALLAGLAATEASAMLRDLAVSLTHNIFGRVSVVAVYVSLLVLLREGATLPLTFYQVYLLERRYGLSAQSFRSWARDHVKTIALSLAIGLVIAEVMYFALAHWPAWWWLLSAAIFMMGLVTLSSIAPRIVLPVFYSIVPLDRPSLRSRLGALSARAGVPVLDVYQWSLGEKTRRANAALVGSGSSRRILLSGTLLAEYSDDQIEVIIAHELGHHVHHDIPKALVVEAALLLAALYAAACALRDPWLTSGLGSIADVAGLPVVSLAGGATMIAAAPLLNALSRANERRADRYALKLTGQPAVFISAMRRLAAQNLAEEYPSRAVRWLFYTHPPFHERIATAQHLARHPDAGQTSDVGLPTSGLAGGENLWVNRPVSIPGTPEARSPKPQV
jgi:STE24 endopeptidase